MNTRQDQYWLNAKGEEVHIGNITEPDKLKNELVTKIIRRAKQKREEMAVFKQEVKRDILDYLDMLRDVYRMEPLSRSKKGNYELVSYDGKLRVQIGIQDTVNFDEKITLAKEKIDTFLKTVTKDSDPIVHTLVMEAFEVDKKGKLSAQNVLKLRTLKVEHPEWKEAMEIIGDSIHIVSSKENIRFHERVGSEGRWQLITLDFSALTEEDTDDTASTTES